MRRLWRTCLLSVLVVTCCVWMLQWITGPLSRPAEPQKHIQRGVKRIPPDKILGTLITHVYHPERRERLTLSEGDPGILVSVKTTTEYHKYRLSLLLFTWLETVPPQQVFIITDANNDPDDVWIHEAKQSGINIVKAACPTGHKMESLCCKSGREFEQYYTAVEAGKEFRWFCHFDDDEYLNFASLLRQLKKYPSSEDYYVGHWLKRLGKKPTSLGVFRSFPEAKRKDFFYATGASYCISAGLMTKVETYFRGKFFSMTCQRIRLTDDITLGAVIGGVLGINLTEVSTMLSQGEDFTQFNTTQLRDMITISSKEHIHNRIKIPHSPFTVAEDPTGFLSYHCLLHPQIAWCHNQTLHVYRTRPH